MSQLVVARSIRDGVPHEFCAKVLPKNFSILKINLWSDMKQLSSQSNDVVAFEVTSSSHDINCILNLAREHEGLVFYRIVLENPEAVPKELINDLGPIGCLPTLAIAYFSDDSIEVAKFEGEADIDAAMYGGMLDDKVTHLLERRAVDKIAKIQSCSRPFPPDPQCCGAKVKELGMRVEELVRRNGELEAAIMTVRCDGAAMEGRQDHVLIQKADTTELGRDVSLPQPVEGGCGTTPMEQDGEEEEEEEEEDLEEGLEVGGGGGGESSLVLDCLPDKLRTKISSLVETFQKQRNNGKISKKYSFAVYDSQLLDIALECCDKTTKTLVMKYLSSMMDVTIKTLYRRTRISQQRKKLQDSLEKLHEAVNQEMPQQLSRYHEALAAAQIADAPVHKKLFKKRFRWSNKTRELLCDIVAVKLEMESKSMYTKDKLAQFLEDEVLPFWPKGWMLKSYLVRHSRSVHNQLFAVTYPNGKASIKQKGRVFSSPAHTSTSGITRPHPPPGFIPSTPSGDGEWPPALTDLTLCEPIFIKREPLSIKHSPATAPH